jgi:hypothetical protein
MVIASQQIIPAMYSEEAIMAIDSIYSLYSAYGTDIYQNQQANSAASKNTSSQSSATGSGSSSQAGASSSYMSGLAGTLSMAIKAAMASLGLKDGDRVTFKTIAEARAKMEEEFQAIVKADLKELGVDESVNFRLITGKDGKVQVQCATDDKKIIEKYLEDNPKVIEEFKKIQALANVEEARKAAGYDPRAIRNRIQVESLVAWFDDTGNSVSNMMDYFNGNTMFAAGIKRTI